MSDSASKPRALDEALARFRTPHTLDEFVEGVPVLESWDQLDIPT